MKTKKPLSEKAIEKNYQYVGKKKLYRQEDVAEAVEELKRISSNLLEANQIGVRIAWELNQEIDKIFGSFTNQSPSAMACKSSTSRTDTLNLCKCEHERDCHLYRGYKMEKIGECMVTNCPCKKFQPVSNLCANCRKDLSNDPDYHYSGYCMNDISQGATPKGNQSDAPEKFMVKELYEDKGLRGTYVCYFSDVIKKKFQPVGRSKR